MLDELLKKMVEHNHLPEDAVPLVKKLFPGGGKQLYQGQVYVDGGEFDPDDLAYLGPARFTRTAAALDALRYWVSQYLEELILNLNSYRESRMAIQLQKRLQKFLQRDPPRLRGFSKIRAAIRVLHEGSGSAYPSVSTIDVDEPAFTKQKAEADLARRTGILIAEIQNQLAEHAPSFAADMDNDTKLKALMEALKQRIRAQE